LEKKNAFDNEITTIVIRLVTYPLSSSVISEPPTLTTVHVFIDLKYIRQPIRQRPSRGHRRFGSPQSPTVR
jgi:hypothetical protein